MDAPYRNDAEALKARLASLEERLVEVRIRREELTAVQQLESQLEREIDELRRERAPRALPILEDVRIASPCSAAWDAMIGDDRARFCAHCKKDVYNLSEMSRDEAARFLAERETGACIRLYRRRDGTVLTTDCPVGARQRSRRWGVLATLGGLLVSALLVREYGFPSRAAAALRKLGIEVTERRIDPPQVTMGAIN